MLLNTETVTGLAGETTFSDYPQSELTFSGSARSKKRAYMALSQHNNLQVQSGLDGFAGATTSRCTIATVLPPLSGDIVSSQYRKRVEIDALVKYQTQQLQSGFELLKRKHSIELMSLVEQQVTKRLRVKEMELESVTKRNVELEEQARHMAAESQVCFNYAKITESVVLGLRAKLDQVLADQIAFSAIDVEAGYGDCCSNTLEAADDAEEESTTENKIQRACRVCNQSEACVLLLPCRHLCLCKRCESRIETCPICNTTSNAIIQVAVL